jgi:hypothetical protein
MHNCQNFTITNSLASTYLNTNLHNKYVNSKYKKNNDIKDFSISFVPFNNSIDYKNNSNNNNFSNNFKSNNNLNRRYLKAWWKEKPLQKYFFNETNLKFKKSVHIPIEKKEFQICAKNSIRNSFLSFLGNAINITFCTFCKNNESIYNYNINQKVINKKSDNIFIFDNNTVNLFNNSKIRNDVIRSNYINMNLNLNLNSNSNIKIKLIHNKPINYVFFTESDQILRFKNKLIFETIVKATNATTYFLGLRKEKNRDSNPADYMKNLNLFRKDCGIDNEKYILNISKNSFVYRIY